jgi:hypothetical protein
MALNGEVESAAALADYSKLPAELVTELDSIREAGLYFAKCFDTVLFKC